jgi:phage gpG-like protein
MSSIKVTLNAPNIKSVLAFVTRLKNGLQDLRPAFNSMGKGLNLSHDDRFRQEISPDGVKWEPNADSTIIAYARRRGGKFGTNKKTGFGKVNKRGIRAIAIKKILRDSGVMQDTLAYQTSATQLRFGVSPAAASYGIKNHFGDPEHRIPARPFIGLSASDVDMIIAEMVQYIRMLQEGR